MMLAFNAEGYRLWLAALWKFWARRVLGAACKTTTLGRDEKLAAKAAIMVQTLFFGFR